MTFDGIERKRMSRISIDARNAINMLIDNADNLWWSGNYSLQCKANDLYIIAEKIYRKEVLYRKFN